ncbi:MAG: TetR/AcrR family transcriptional regulator [Acidobacteria bacterium]|nr:TetR/AcrR family transcriptional regulator [Acidobacteriota bacterium]
MEINGTIGTERSPNREGTGSILAEKAAATDGARERLLKAATEVFNRKGYAAASVSEIVADAGVTKPVLYYYFANKEGIYREIMETAFALFDEVLDRDYAHCPTVREKITALFDDVVDLFRRHLPVVRLFHAIYYGPPQGVPFIDFHAKHIKWNRVILDRVEEGVRRGEFLPLDPLDMTQALMAAVIYRLDLLLCPEIENYPMPDHRRLLDIVFRGILPPGRV